MLQNIYIYLYIYICSFASGFEPHYLIILSSYTAAAILYLLQWDAHI